MVFRFVQFRKNSCYHYGIKRSPCETLFGTKAVVGLTSSSLPKEMIDNLQHEEELLSSLNPIYQKNTESDDETNPISAALFQISPALNINLQLTLGAI